MPAPVAPPASSPTTVSQTMVPPTVPQPPVSADPTALKGPVSPAMQKAMQGLRRVAGGSSDAEPSPAPAKPASPAPAQPPSPKPQEAPKPPAPASTAPADAPEEGEGSPTPPAPAKPATEPPKGQKQSPWKVVETYKSKLAAVERELADTKKQIADPEMVSRVTKRAEAAEQRAKELETEIRYYDYTKSSEFREKYQEPFVRAWHTALKDVTQLAVTEADGVTKRPATAEDLWGIVNLNLGEATDKAVELFGERLGAIVMANHYGKIRDLYAAQNEALEKARTEGVERENARVEQARSLQESVAKSYQETRRKDAERLPWMKEKDGDDEWNEKLAHASEFVERTLRAPLADPKLSPDQREELIANKVAVHNRAIGFSMLKLENKRLKADLANVRKELDSFKSVQPGGGTGKPSAGDGAVSGSPMERALGDLRGRAK